MGSRRLQCTIAQHEPSPDKIYSRRLVSVLWVRSSLPDESLHVRAMHRQGHLHHVSSCQAIWQSWQAHHQLVSCTQCRTVLKKVVHPFHHLNGVYGCRRDTSSAQPLHGLAILDVGCGGGLFSEALARLGASVTGIDASEAGILVAREHARADPDIHARTSYRNITAEQALDEGRPNCLESSTLSD